jgi:hypothetical protein
MKKMLFQKNVSKSVMLFLVLLLQDKKSLH